MRARRGRTIRRNEDQISLAQKWALRKSDPGGFVIKNFDGKGRGVVTTKAREKGEFLLIYDGEKISGKEGEKREKKVPSCFRFFYVYDSKTYCVDATKETGRLGRLVNHGDMVERNTKMQRITGSNGDSLLALISTRSIREGEEILYDYGIDVPWKSTRH